MKHVHVDIETYSPVDLKTAGLYKYAAHPDFEVLMVSFAVGNQAVRTVDLKNEDHVGEFLHFIHLIESDDTLLFAHNAAFERICINKFFKINTPISRWRCTMAMAAYAGLPLSLAKVAEALNTPFKKDPLGKKCIAYFSCPVKPTKTNGMRTRNYPAHDPVLWRSYLEYNAADVEAERSVHEALSLIGVPDNEWSAYKLDQEINDRGVKVDVSLASIAQKMDNDGRSDIMEKVTSVLDIDNPNSRAQLLEFCQNHGYSLEDGTKSTVAEALADTNLPAKVRMLLEAKQQLSKTSIAKYTAMLDAADEDGRMRGLFKYYGANRTGRWSGNAVQPQNLPQNHLKHLNLAREAVLTNDSNLVELCHGDLPNVLSQLIRTAFIPEKGKKLIVVDFSAIEARVLSWLADETWRMDVFATHGKIYEASASKMFKIPFESIGKGSVERQKGKVAELALGYQGGVGALTQMGAEKMGVDPSEFQNIISAWRSANPKIVQFWDLCNKKAIAAVAHKVSLDAVKGVKFTHLKDERNGTHWLEVKLPSSRALYYYMPEISSDQFGNPAVRYTWFKNNGFIKKDQYGGVWVENITQAVARDCLLEIMLRVKNLGYDIVMHVHDEVVVEAPHDRCEQALSDILDAMKTPLPWASGLVLKGEGFICDFYKKD